MSAQAQRWEPVEVLRALRDLHALGRPLLLAVSRKDFVGAITRPGVAATEDELVAAENEEFKANLGVKEALLAEAEAVLPVTDVEAAKATLRVIQDKWERAGKVPRPDMERIEKAIRRVEQAVRDHDEKRWASSNPEAAARAQSLVDQLETAVKGLRKDLEKAEAAGNAKKIADARSDLAAREQWLAQARAGVEEFGS